MKNWMMALVMIAGISAFAKNAKTNAVIEVKEAQIFAPLKGTNATAGYGKIHNLSDKEVTLKIVKADSFKAVETHVTKEKDGHMAMEKVESFKIPAKGSLELKQGGNHIMLFDATREFKAGEELNVQFTVDGKAVETKFKIVNRTEQASPHVGH